MRRRTAIKTLAGMAGAAAASPLLSACGDDAGTGPDAGITHIVAVMMENRSYDHYLGARSLLEGRPGDGLTANMGNPNRAGDEVGIFSATPDLCVPDPPHSWNSSHAQFSGGTNRGFLTEYENRFGSGIAPYPLGYLTRDHLPLYYAMADQFASCDRWFSSVMGPTWPNRYYWHSAQSGGLIQNDLPDGAVDWPTIHHRLDDAGVPWAYYYSDLPVVGLWGNLDLEGRVRRVVYDFFDDAAAGTLPPVTFLDPFFGMGGNDDHPPHHPMLGQQFIGAIYAALANSPLWNHVLFVVTYDEHGGFYDHVAPPLAADDRASEGFDQLGFRVPTLVAGPYVKPGHVSSVTYDHTSLLAHIETMFELPPLTARDAAANDLADCIDLERLAARTPSPPAVLPAIEVDESMLDAACMQRSAPQVELEALADAGFFPRTYDRRGTAPEQLRGIGDVLERFGAGRVRRGR